MPEDATFDVQLYNDSFDDLRFRRIFLKALSLAGYAQSEDAALQFSFHPEYIRPVRRRAGRRMRPYARAKRRPELEPQYPLSYVRVGTNGDAWLIGAKNKWLIRKDRWERNNRPGRLHLNVQLRDSRSRSVLWSADLYCDVNISDRARIEHSMIAPIIARIGQTTKPARFDIR